ncbi:MAG: tRNA-guanine transglycosylase [Candidatus Falkowbacteria bacterium]|nr:tRNA-guanine transglycosylase [Candidatus Falkowbacteria bacterium]
MFDCVIPTREGRHGRLYLNSLDGGEAVNILNSKYKSDKTKINKDSKIKELKKYSKAYLHHLFKVNDSLGSQLASLNNLEFYSCLINQLK